MAATTTATTKTDLTALLAAGKLKADTTLTAKFKGADHKAKITEDGKVKVGRKVYGSLSAAAKAVRVDAGGSDHYVSGWTFWKLDNGMPIDELR